MRTCKTCGEEKDESEFYPSKTSKGGIMVRCRKCVYKANYASSKRRKTEMLPEQVVALRKKNSAATRAYYQRHPGKAVEAQRRYFQKNRDREKVKNRLTYAIKAGKVLRAPCFVCGCEEVHGHHADYSQPLQVVWLCNEHHWETHRMAKAIDKAAQSAVN